MSELTYIFGRILTTIGDKQRSKVANLAQYVNLQGCCACYGPPGKSGVYCGQECQPKNGGIITKNVNALFWVRLNPPQKVWEKCMEYQTEEENGDAAWYKLVGDRNVPVKIVVVPDDVTADKVPHITGLLAYQKDSAVLRLRKNDTWKAIAEEEMVLKINNKTLAKLELMVNLLYSRDITTSAILRNEPDKFLEKLLQWITSEVTFSSLQRCYRASEDGWLAHHFHFHCGGIGRTLTLIKVGRYIFGGYSENSWGIIGDSATYKSDSDNFIFSLRNKDNLDPFKSDVYQNNNNGIYAHPSYGPTFGGGYDIKIPWNAKESNGYTNFGYTYRPPSGYSYGNSNTRALLAGSYNFKASEIEVYYFHY